MNNVSNPPQENERRIANRLPYAHHVELYNGIRHKAIALNLSDTGIGVEYVHALLPGASVDVEFLHGALTVPAVVSYCYPQPRRACYRLGLRFEKQEQALVEALTTR